MKRTMLMVVLALVPACKGSARVDRDTSGMNLGATQAQPSVVKSRGDTVDADDVTSGAAPAPAPAPALELVEGWAGVKSEGFLHIVGEVKNKSPYPVSFVRVDIEILDAAGKPLDTKSILSGVADDLGKAHMEFATGDVAFVPPGGSTPFHYIRDVKKIQGTYGKHKLTAQARRAAAAVPVAQIEGATMKPEKYELFQLTGTLRNTGSLPCRSPEPILGFYGKDGQLKDVVEVGGKDVDAWFQKEMPPGQSLTFDVRRKVDFAGEIATMKAWATCTHQ